MVSYVNCQEKDEKDTTETSTPVAILKQINKVNDDGSYTFGYEAADGTFKVETRDIDGNVKGKYGYLDETGQLKTVEYSAGKTDGFTAKGHHLPEPVPALPVPAAPLPGRAPSPVAAATAPSFNQPPPQPQFTAQQQFAQQQFAPQQQFPQQHFAPQQQFVPRQQFAAPVQQFAPQQQLNNPLPIPQLQAPRQQFAAPQNLHGFQQVPALTRQDNSIDQGNDRRQGFSFSFTAPATFPQPQQPFNSFAPLPQFNSNQRLAPQPFRN